MADNNMDNTVLNQQIQELKALWHRILLLDHNKDVKRNFPDFLELTTNEISVIQVVSQHPDIILKSICERLDLPKSTLTNTINRLEEKGYLFRTITRKDLRSYGLTLTDKGIQAQKEHMAYEQLVFGKILEILTSEERTEFLMLIKKITENLEIDLLSLQM